MVFHYFNKIKQKTKSRPKGRAFCRHWQSTQGLPAIAESLLKLLKA